MTTQGVTPLPPSSGGILPVNKLQLKTYPVFDSAKVQTFISYLWGFEGVYCNNFVLPLNGTRVSSTDSSLAGA